MRLSWFACLLGLGWASACSACDGGSDGQPDSDAAAGAGGTGAAGGTAGGVGAGGSGASAGADAAPDAPEGSKDADADFWNPDPEHWELAPWNPPECQYLQAKDAKAALPAYQWLDCDNGIAGCVTLDTSALAGSAPNNGEKLGTLFDVRKLGGATLFAALLALGTYDWTSVLYDVATGPIMAWRTVNYGVTGCVIGDARFGVEGGAAQRVTYKLPGGGLRSRVVYGELPSLTSAGVKFLDVDESATGNPLSTVFRVEFSSSVMALEVGMSPVIYVWDYTGKPELVPRPPPISEDHSAIVQGAEMVFNRYSSSAAARAFAVRHPDGTIENLYQKPSVWAASLRSDRIDITWQEMHLTTGVLELWTSPWATTPAGMKPAKVRVVEGANQNLVRDALGEKWWAYFKDDSTMRVIRITDGYWVDAPPPKGLGWSAPVAVVDGELWGMVHAIPGAVGNIYSLVRVPIASLGTPQP